jgi:hypothetical protein
VAVAPAVKRLRPRLEGAHDPLHRLVEEQPRRALQSLFLNSKSTSKATSQPPSSRSRNTQVEFMWLNGPSIYSVSIRRVPFPHRHPRQEAFAEHLEAHDEVREHHVAVALGRDGPHARGRDPRDEFRVIRDIATRSYICSAV